MSAAMTDDQVEPVALLISRPSPLGDEIARRLRNDGFKVIRSPDDPAEESPRRLDAVVINRPGRNRGVGFLDLQDEAFTDGLADFLDFVSTLQATLARLRPGGALVVLASRGYLGAWGGADEAAFSGATLGLLRAIALENSPRGIRANVVVTDFAASQAASSAAGAVAFLLGDDALGVNGETILANSGHSLRRREARDRRRELSR